MDKSPIFITGRFRSGSTLLWHIFRETEVCTTFYEPCHDMLIGRLQYSKEIDLTHKDVDSYWAEYVPIQKTLLLKHRAEFGTQRLLLEETDSHPQLEEYINYLINAAEKTPVLQFNRIDFRLPWFRKRFEDARLIHLYRDPRDQWMSMAKNLPREAWDNPFENMPYDLLVWSCSLIKSFPFLFSSVIKTSYHRHYMLWRLSKLMGERYSDLSISFESLVDNPEDIIRQLMDIAGLSDIDVCRLASIVKPPERGIWRNVVDEKWFLSAEKECESLLERLGLIENFGHLWVSTIRDRYLSEWTVFEADSANNAIQALLSLFTENRQMGYINFKGAEQAYHTSRDMWNNLVNKLKSLYGESQPISDLILLP